MLTYIRQCLRTIRAHGRPLPFSCEVAASEDIDVCAELALRAPHAWQHVPHSGGPRAIAVIVGVPRSGTSHLFNLLARTGGFSYFTTASCWAWPVRHLRHPGRQLFTAVGDAVLTADTKRTRVIPALVMPGEAEDIWAHTIPVYRTSPATGMRSTSPGPGSEPSCTRQPARTPATSGTRCYWPNHPSVPSASPRSRNCEATQSATSTSSGTRTRQPARYAATTSSSSARAGCSPQSRRGRCSPALYRSTRPQTGWSP